MKKVLSFAICAMAVLAMMFAMDSCKKENQNVKSNNNAAVSHFDPSHITDMNTYLGEFKQKMKQSQYTKDNETLSLEEAAWHLSSVANYDFANANVEFTDLLYDTLYYQVDVTNGQVAMSDLNAVYADMADDIDEYYQNLDLQDKHFRFIGADITEDGQVRANMIITYTVLDHTWYYEDVTTAYMDCYGLMNSTNYFNWNTTAVDTLEHILNLLEGRTYVMPNEPIIERVFFVYTTEADFTYDNYIDPLGSPFFRNSRLYAVDGDTYSTHVLDFNEMCYCVDSYLGLAYEHLQGLYNSGNQAPVCFSIEPKWYDNPFNYKWDIFCHDLNVKFGQVVNGTENPIQY